MALHMLGIINYFSNLKRILLILMIPHPELVYEDRKSDFSYGFDYSINSNFTIGASYERGNYFSFEICIQK